MFGEITNDHRIIAVALNYHNEQALLPEKERQSVVLVSKDVLMRIKADVLGLEAKDYVSDPNIQENDRYVGFFNMQVHPSIIDEFYNQRFLNIKICK